MLRLNFGSPSRQRATPATRNRHLIRREAEVSHAARATDLDTIGTMTIGNGTISGDVEYTNHEDGTWSFKLTFEDDPVPNREYE